MDTKKRPIQVRRLTWPPESPTGPRVPLGLVTDRRVTGEAVRLYAYLSTRDRWSARISRLDLAREVSLADVGMPLLELENAGWIVVHRGEDADTLILLWSRLTTPEAAVLQAFPEGIPQGIDSPADALAADSAVA